MKFRPSSVLFVGLGIGINSVIGSSSADVRVEQAAYREWPGSYRMTNGTVELVFVPQIGRIVRFGFVGGQNVLWENPALFGKTVDLKNPGKDWVNFGGDKLWPAPQSRWNWPPNPILDAGGYRVKVMDRGRLMVTGLPSEKDGIRFSRLIIMSSAGTRVSLLNSMRSVKRSGKVRWSIWEVAQVDDPDRAILPLHKSRFREGFYVFKGNEPSPDHLARSDQMVFFRRDRKKGAKIGGASPEGWLVSEKGGTQFRVSAKYPLKGPYPDDGCAQEIWSNPDPLKYMELELLSPIVTLTPGKTYTFETRWELKKL